MAFTTEEREGIVGLMFGSDKEDLNTVYEIIEVEENEGVKEFLTELFVIYTLKIKGWDQNQRAYKFLESVLDEVSGLGPAIGLEDKLKANCTEEWLNKILQLCPSLNKERLLAGMFRKFGQKLKLWKTSSEEKQLETVAACKTDGNLTFIGTGFTKIPKAILEQEGLIQLDLSDNKLKSLPKDITKLHNLKSLNLSRNKLKKLPKGIGDLEQLEVLDLSRNQLTGLPKEFARLVNLRELNLSWNLVNPFPASIAELPKLEKLNIGTLSISYVPQEMEKSFFNLKSKNLIEIILDDSIGRIQEYWTNLPAIK